MKKINMIGKRFGRLLVVAESEPAILPCGQTQSRVLCQCDCGNIKTIKASSLRRGDTKSCGCILRETPPNLQHGHSPKGGSSSTYNSRACMIQRCTNPHTKDYKDYGARGIRVCERWLDSFENFLADMGERPEGMTLERLNNDGNYEPSNCQWATDMEQKNNRSDNVLIFNGEGYSTMAQFARAFGIPYQRFHHLYQKRKLTVEQILLQEDCLR